MLCHASNSMYPNTNKEGIVKLYVTYTYPNTGGSGYVVCAGRTKLMGVFIVVKHMDTRGLSLLGANDHSVQTFSSR